MALLRAVVGAALVLSASTEAIDVDGSCRATGESVLLQLDSHRSRLTRDLVKDSSCDEGRWPDVDRGLVCGTCKVLVDRFSSFYKTCDGYCSQRGRSCVGAWEERDDTCDVLYTMTCDQQIESSDAICECSAALAADSAGSEQEAESQCDAASWPDKDHGLVCGDCKVLVDRFKSVYKTCDGYCRERGRQCTGAWEERDDTCDVLRSMTCDEEIDSSDAICQCGAEVTEPSGCTGPTCRSIKVMSYNTEYRGYRDGRMGDFASKIKEVAPAIVGLQECQDRDGLAALSGYAANRETGRQNYMLFDPSKVTFLSGGVMSIPRDNYAPRAITWGQFSLDGKTIWFFNTHLPHNHNEAASKRTHARIADMLLQKRKDLGAENAPTIVVGDMNSHASDFNRVQGGGFESNLEANGFVWAYTARGDPGHKGIDHILYSAPHWTHRNCRDSGTGRSDHTSITCDLTLK